MPVFDQNLLSRFFAEGEKVYSDTHKFLKDRLSLNILAGTAAYTLPDYVRSIRRITYLGSKLEPLPRRHARDAFGAYNSSGRPYWYVYNNIGLNKISLYPTPSASLSAVTNLWKAPAISAGCVVEFYRVSDNNLFVLPDFIKRQLLKQYVMMKVFSVDGHGSNAKLVQYFTQRWALKAGECSALFEELQSKPRKLGLLEHSGLDNSIGDPVLPIDRFGTSVDVGD